MRALHSRIVARHLTTRIFRYRFLHDHRLRFTCDVTFARLRHHFAAQHTPHLVCVCGGDEGTSAIHVDYVTVGYARRCRYVTHAFDVHVYRVLGLVLLALVYFHVCLTSFAISMIVVTHVVVRWSARAHALHRVRFAFCHTMTSRFCLHVTFPLSRSALVLRCALLRAICRAPLYTFTIADPLRSTFYTHRISLRVSPRCVSAAHGTPGYHYTIFVYRPHAHATYHLRYAARCSCDHRCANSAVTLTHTVAAPHTFSLRCRVSPAHRYVRTHVTLYRCVTSLQTPRDHHLFCCVTCSLRWARLAFSGARSIGISIAS